MMIVERFANTLNPADGEVLACIADFAKWQVGRRQTEFQITSMDDVQIRTYLLHLRLKGASQKELEKTVSSLSKFCRWARIEGLVEKDLFESYNFERPFLSREEIRRRQGNLPEDPHQREMSLLMAINELAKALNQVADIQAILDVTLDILISVMDISTAWIFVLPEIHTHMAAGSIRTAHDFVLAAARGLTPGLEYNDRYFLCQPPDCSCQSKMRRGHLTRAVNIVECTRIQDSNAEAGDNRGLLFHASTPLIASDRQLGIINIATEEWQFFTSDDLQFLSTVGSQVAVALERARLYDIARTQNLRLESELKMAREVQASLYPDSYPDIPGIDFAAYLKPALEVSGDFYDLFPIGDDRLGLLIADVSDKGAPAAMYMAMAHSLIKANAYRKTGPATTLMEVNKYLIDHSSADMFVTVFYGELDIEAGILNYANAGHDPPLLRRREGNIEHLRATGPLIGSFEGVILTEEQVVLEPGDVLLAYTDGVTDAANPEMEHYGIERLIAATETAQTLADSLLKLVLADLAAFCKDAPQPDDVTLFVVNMNL